MLSHRALGVRPLLRGIDDLKLGSRRRLGVSMRKVVARGKGAIFVDMKEDDDTGMQSIGPGQLVILTGQTVAGKDTLLAHAKLACAGDTQMCSHAGS
jgi:hypothetical protein